MGVMDRDSCPFCGTRERAIFGLRGGRTFVRCKLCASIYADIAREAYEALHEEMFLDDEFLTRIEGALGRVPNFSLWSQIIAGRPITTGRVLEIGPGTGHLLAAAAIRGWEPIGVESSSHHRAYIKRNWGLNGVFENLDEIEPGARFDLIVLINVLEHVFDVLPLLEHLAGRLQPGGEIFLSLPNARCITATLFGTRWSMFKPVDHVSIPTAQGLEALGRRAGLRVERLWSSELPMETLVGAAVALRDYRCAGTTEDVSNQNTSIETGGAQRRILNKINAMNPRWEPVNQIMGWLGRAATVKCRYQLP